MGFSRKVLERSGGSLHDWLGGDLARRLVVFTDGATVDHHEWDATTALVAEQYGILEQILTG